MNSSPLIEKSAINALERNSQEVKDLRLGAEHVEDEGRVEWAELIRIAFVVLAAAAVWFRLWEPYPRISVRAGAGRKTHIFTFAGVAMSSSLAITAPRITAGNWISSDGSGTCCVLSK